MLYLLKLSIGLTVVYLFYQVLLRKLTFYNWNRWYLLGYSVLCFFIPLIDVLDLLQQQGLQHTAVIHYIPAITQLADAETGAATEITMRSIDGRLIMLVIFSAGSLFMGVRLLLQYLSLRRLKTSATLLADGNVKIYHIDKPIIPFTAGNAIYVNRHLHEEQELKEIIRHEFIHVKQRHSIDLWWGEILCILNWYNPFAWLLRNAMRQNLEFIADHQVLQSGLSVKQYQYLLLKVTGNPSFSIASNFNFSSLKKRIVMMNKNKSANRHLVRFLCMLPLLAVVLLAFRGVSVGGGLYTEKKFTDTVPATNPTDLLKQKGIKDLHISKNDKDKKAIIKFLDGTTKIYDLNKPAEKKAFEDEYGDLVPPPPPAAPRASAARVAAPAAPAAAGVSPAVAMPAPPAPSTPPAPPAPVKDGVAEVRVSASNFDVVEVPVHVTGTAHVTGTGHVSGGSTPSNIVLTADVIEISSAEPVKRATPPTAPTPAMPVSIEETTQLLEIKNTTTREELERMAEELKAKGYALTLKNINFDDGKITSLEGSINNGQGKGGFAADNFKSMTISVSKDQPDRFHVLVRSGSVRM
jgi:beta-lactamase regulating signal transducer with metallopeptidase domain